MNKILVIIPSYKPDHNLVNVVRGLKEKGFSSFLVVNDGSPKEFNAIFNEVKSIEGVIYVDHIENQGKGAALKNAFRHALAMPTGSVEYVLTVDADGQHLPDDCLLVAQHTQPQGKAIVLGSRKFVGHVPARSKFGNVLTRKMCGLVYNLNLTDTQTGLRLIPLIHLHWMVKIFANRYEYELEMLIKAHNKKIELKEVEIQTIYEDGNKSSHFNPLIDSFKIYFVLFRFVITSFFTSLVDIAVFSIVNYLGNSIFMSMVVARIVAGTFNFKVNRKYVFHSRESEKRELFKFIITVFCFGLISYGLTAFLKSQLNISVIVAKVCAEVFLFLMNFIIQKNIVFARSARPSDFSSTI